MYTETKKDPPKSIYVNPYNMEVVGKGYPNAIEYVRKDEETKTYMNDMSFIGHAK